MQVAISLRWSLRFNFFGLSSKSLMSVVRKPPPPVALEVKSVRVRYSLVDWPIFDRLLYNAVVADKCLQSRFKLIVVEVYHFDKSQLERVQNQWQRRIEKCPAKVELRFIHRDELNDA